MGFCSVGDPVKSCEGCIMALSHSSCTEGFCHSQSCPDLQSVLWDWIPNLPGLYTLTLNLWENSGNKGIYGTLKRQQFSTCPFQAYCHLSQLILLCCLRRTAQPFSARDAEHRNLLLGQRNRATRGRPPFVVAHLLSCPCIVSAEMDAGWRS